MEFELLTLEGVKFKGEVSQITLTSSDGDMGILPHHEPLTAQFLPGPVTVISHGKKEVFATFGGLLEVQPEQVRMLADEAEHQDELITSDVEAALKRAQEMKAKAKDKHELAIAQHLVDRHEVRLNVARMRRSQKRPTETARKD